MQFVNLNNHKIYNLTARKSLPEGLSDKQKRKLQKDDSDLRRRIELIQFFEMPVLSSCVRLSRNRRYILATGVYKPRVRCFDTAHMSMKFDRCMDAEVVTFDVLSDDYSKMVFLQNDRFVEFHNQAGVLYRTRIPMFGRDFAYQRSKAELFFVGRSKEIIRMNLERATFMNPIVTPADEILCCQMNELHEFLACGTRDGRLEIFDPRTRGRINGLDCAATLLANSYTSNERPGVSAVKYSGALSLAVGTTTGQILLFDIRSSKPITIKDHMFGLPIKNIEFARTETNHDVILSGDSRIVKIWERDTGKPYTSVEPGVKLNDVCLIKDSGLMFIANETEKIQTYFIPDLGPAPGWASRLTSLTEQLEENPDPQRYDHFKFISEDEAKTLGIWGTDLAMPCLNGFMVKMNLYLKAKAIAEPFSFKDYKKKELAKKIEPKSRIKNNEETQNLPAVNKTLVKKLMEDDEQKAKIIVNDDRFKDLFMDQDFEVEEDATSGPQKMSSHKSSDEDVSDDDDEEDEYKKEMNRLSRSMGTATNSKAKTSKRSMTIEDRLKTTNSAQTSISSNEITFTLPAKTDRRKTNSGKLDKNQKKR